MKSRGPAVVFAFGVACGCGGKTTKQKTPSTDVVVTDVDGGTIVGTASPDTRKHAQRGAQRGLSNIECRAYRLHLAELIARDMNMDPNEARNEVSGDNAELCDRPVYSDEIIDCLLMAKTFAELPRCMKSGAPPLSP